LVALIGAAEHGLEIVRGVEMHQRDFGEVDVLAIGEGAGNHAVVYRRKSSAADRRRNRSAEMVLIVGSPLVAAN